MVPVDLKKAGRIPDGGGWRMHGRDSARAKAVGGAKSAGARRGYTYLHSAIDGVSRLSCIEPLCDERGAITAAFLARAKGLVRRPRYQQVDFGQLLVVEDLGVNLGPCAYRLLKAPVRSTCTLRWPAMRLPWQRGRSRTVYSID